jgi:hypothetical protein
MPAFDGGDDFVWVCSPCEGFWTLVCLVDEAVDSGLEIDDGSEDAALQPPPGQLGEEAFDGVEPRTRSGREVEREAFMASKPCPDLGMLGRQQDNLRSPHVFLGRITIPDQGLQAPPIRCFQTRYLDLAAEWMALADNIERTVAERSATKQG